MWQRMMRVWLVGAAVAVVTLDGAPPEPPPPDAQVAEQPDGARQDAVGERRDQGIST